MFNFPVHYCLWVYQSGRRSPCDLCNPINVWNFNAYTWFNMSVSLKSVLETDTRVTRYNPKWHCSDQTNAVLRCIQQLIQLGKMCLFRSTQPILKHMEIYLVSEVESYSGGFMCEVAFTKSVVLEKSVKTWL